MIYYAMNVKDIASKSHEISVVSQYLRDEKILYFLPFFVGSEKASISKA